MEELDISEFIQRDEKKHSKIKIILATCAVTFCVITLIYAIIISYLFYEMTTNTTNDNDVGNTPDENNPYVTTGGDMTNLIPTHSPNHNDIMTCQIKKLSSNIHRYPSVDKFTYAIDFNTTTSQANYVYYISTAGGNSESGQSWKKDPYDINILRSDDYTNTGYDRGHLVPNADYGADTYYITNAVPMVPNFNRGAWSKSEQYIRSTYVGKLVYKGCEYTEKSILSNKNNKLYIPQGCYYIIFDSSVLTDLTKDTIGSVLEYGYYENIANSVKQNKLPDWIECSNIKSNPTKNPTKPFIVQKSGVTMKVYNIPGTYTITPTDYNYADNIIIEAWGGGGGGSIRSHDRMGRGGGSGGYIKSGIVTNQQNFIIHVGRGSNGEIHEGTDYSVKYPTEGNSWVQKSTDILFVAGVGGTGVSKYDSDEPAGENTLKSKNLISFNSVKGGSYFGGKSPNGGIGGHGCYIRWNGTKCIYLSNVTNGDSPGGGGGNGCRGSDIQCYNIFHRGGNGGNGGIIIYS